MFVQMMYQLLHSYKFPFKYKRMLVSGPSDSGKTTLIVPILEVLDEDKVASVTREGRFCAQMLNKQTQLLFIDEWRPDALQVDDAKFIFQGGRQCISVKNMAPKTFVFRSGAFITCNNVSHPYTFA